MQWLTMSSWVKSYQWREDLSVQPKSHPPFPALHLKVPWWKVEAPLSF
jgi:hypothetical protein